MLRLCISQLVFSLLVSPSLPLPLLFCPTPLYYMPPLPALLTPCPTLLVHLQLGDPLGPYPLTLPLLILALPRKCSYHKTRSTQTSSSPRLSTTLGLASREPYCRSPVLRVRSARRKLGLGQTERMPRYDRMKTGSRSR